MPISVTPRRQGVIKFDIDSQIELEEFRNVLEPAKKPVSIAARDRWL